MLKRPMIALAAWPLASSVCMLPDKNLQQGPLSLQHQKIA